MEADVQEVALEGAGRFGPASLRFSEPRFKDDSELADLDDSGDAYWLDCVCTLNVDGREFEVDMWMIEPFRFDMLGFFEELALLPEDWVGEDDWSSENGEVLVKAMGLGEGTMVLRVEVGKPSWRGGEGTRTAGLVVATTDVARFANELRLFLRVPHGSRIQRCSARPRS